MKLIALCVVMLTLGCGHAISQTYKVLWSFGGPNDGFQPMSSLIFDGKGNLYGTTQDGGAAPCSIYHSCGTVFELSPQGDGTWTETVLYYFCSQVIGGQCTDGASPQAGLVFDSKGNLYGTTAEGGAVPCTVSSAGCGTLFELSPPLSPGGAWTESVLHNFCSSPLGMYQCLDGATPTSQLVLDGSGNLYGTTTLGGTSDNYGGTVFELSASSSGWQYEVLYNFCAGGGAGCPDGTRPRAGVTFDKFGNLYGTTWAGGIDRDGGLGTLYELAPSASGWSEETLIVFGRGYFGQAYSPLGTVSIDPAGNLYSTTSAGGGENWGSVFKFAPKSHTTNSVLFNGTDGNTPTAGVLIDSARRSLFGTTSGGPPNGYGNVFKINASGQETVLYSFCQQTNCADGQYPYAGLVEDEAGNLYGTTVYGGTYGQGVVFEIMP